MDSTETSVSEQQVNDATCLIFRGFFAEMPGSNMGSPESCFSTVTQ